MLKIVLNTIINAPREVVFDLSRSIDFHIKSTEQTKEKAIAGKTSVRQVGTPYIRIVV